MQSIDKVIGSKLKEYREERNLTQREVAYLTALDPMTISRIERGIRLPSIPSLILIAKALGVTATEIVQEVELIDLGLEVQEPPTTAYRKKGRSRKKHTS